LYISRVLTVILLLAAPLVALAQSTNITLGGINADPGQPVEVTADSLTIDQNTRTAVFAGNVLIGQGDMRISAARAEVIYADGTGDIARFLATGGVTFVTPTEAAEAEEADYDLTSGLLVLSGKVLLTQGASALSAEKMTVNLKDGTAQMEGRVRTVFQQGNN
jgi:lipopolysaccharide export system protein LptA